jgi:hypothetical protein
MRVKVKSGCTGFIHGKLLAEGVEFDLEGHAFSDNWMEKVKTEKPVKATRTRKAKQELDPEIPDSQAE